MRNEPAPLHGITVIDASTLFAGPLAATCLGDFGADVIKIEHPERGDPSRNHGPSVEGVGIWWKVLGRNKRPIDLNLSSPSGRTVFLKMAASADVIIENFRPGTLERWGLSYEELSARNPGLILARVTTFGQVGPYSSRPGFGTLAEAMSGFAHMTGEREGPPTLPPFGLADGIAGISTALAVAIAIIERAKSGLGQVIDQAIVDPIMTVVGSAISVFDLTGAIQNRNGNRSVNNAPRNTYKTRDGHWVAISTSAQSIAERVMRLVGREDVLSADWFQSGRGRAAHADELDASVAAWMASRDREEVLAEFERVEGAIAPVYSAADIVQDPQFLARPSVVDVSDDELGSVIMQNVLFHLSRTPGGIRWAGRPRGASTREILEELGLFDEDVDPHPSGLPT